MPTIPQQSQSTYAERTKRRPRSTSSFQSDTAERIRLRSDDFLQILPQDQTLQLSPRSIQHPEDSPLQSLDSQSQPLARRQTYISNLPATYAGENSGPSSGTVVGIVLGVVLGYILLSWLIVTLLTNRAEATYIEGRDTTEIDGHHSSKRSRRSHRSRRARTEVSELSDRPPPPRREPDRSRRERILVTETVRREGSRAPPPPMSPRSGRETDININIERSRSRPAETRVQGDDFVEVVEEASSITSGTTPDPKPRRESRRSGGGGVRHVDPNQYAGGNYPRHEYERSRSRR